MPEPMDSKELLLKQGMQLLTQALEADNEARAIERLQAARAITSTLGHLEDGTAHRRILAIHGTRVRNVLSNRRMLAGSPDADQLVQCDYCKALVYPIPEEEAQQSNWNNRRCADHQDVAEFPRPEGGPVP